MSKELLKQLNDAAQHGKLEVVRQLLEAGVGIYQGIPDHPEEKRLDPAPLILAAQQGHLETVQLLLQSKANVNGMFSNGSTALYHAASQGHTEIVRELILKGADVNTQVIDDYEELVRSTPCTVAAQSGNTDCVQLLLAAKATINDLTASGESALCRAMMFRRQRIVKQLLSAGARVGAAQKIHEILKGTEGSAFWQFALIAGLNINAINLFDFIARTPGIEVRGSLLEILKRMARVQGNLKTTIHRLLYDVLEKGHITVKPQRVLHAIQYMLLLIRTLKMIPTPRLGQREDPGDLQNLREFLLMEDDKKLDRKDSAINQRILSCIQRQSVSNELLTPIRENLLEEAGLMLFSRIYSLDYKVVSFLFYGIQDPTHPLFRFIKTRWEWNWEKGPWVDPVTIASTTRYTP